MGATFCNLFCREEQADAVKNRLAGSDKFLSGYHGWCMALAEDRNPTNMMRIAKKTEGDVLVFFWFDDDIFELTYFQNGKKASSVSSGLKSSKLAAMAGLLPDDPLALKKLRAIKDCISIEEKLTLLEETFGLPFYALHEQETVSPIERSDHTWNAVKTRKAALRNRPNRFRVEELAREDWPYSTKIRMDLIGRLRGAGYSFMMSRLLFDLPHRLSEQPGCPSRLFTAGYIGELTEEGVSGYNTIIMANYQEKKIITYRFSSNVGEPLAFNSANDVICDMLDSDGVVCLNEKGEEQWRFAPELEKPAQRLTFIRTDREEIILLSEYGSKEVDNRLWRVSPEDGHILTERVMPAGEFFFGFRWLPDMACFTYYEIESNSVVILDQDFGEIRRLQLGSERIRFDVGFYSGYDGYAPVLRRDGSWYLVQLNLVTGGMKTICPELSASIHQVLSDGTFVCVTDESVKGVNLLDHEGRLISRHRLKGGLMGVWEEDRQIYAATISPSRLPGLWEDSQIDTVKIFRLVDTSVNE